MGLYTQYNRAFPKGFTCRVKLAWGKALLKPGPTGWEANAISFLLKRCGNGGGASHLLSSSPWKQKAYFHSIFKNFCSTSPKVRESSLCTPPHHELSNVCTTPPHRKLSNICTTSPKVRESSPCTPPHRKPSNFCTTSPKVRESSPCTPPHCKLSNFCSTSPKVRESSPCTPPHWELSKDTKNMIWSIPVRWIS